MVVPIIVARDHVLGSRRYLVEIAPGNPTVTLMLLRVCSVDAGEHVLLPAIVIVSEDDNDTNNADTHRRDTTHAVTLTTNTCCRQSKRDDG